MARVLCSVAQFWLNQGEKLVKTGGLERTDIHRREERQRRDGEAPRSHVSFMRV